MAYLLSKDQLAALQVTPDELRVLPARDRLSLLFQHATVRNALWTTLAIFAGLALGRRV